MKISFVILNYNREAEVLQTIEKTHQLMQGRTDYEIIIVDNASTDNSVASLKALSNKIKLVTRPSNNGIAGWNDGFAEASGKYMVVLDDDSNVESGIDEAINYLDVHSEVGVLSLNITGGAFQTDDRVDLQDCTDFIGCGAVIRKEVYNKIGGFAEWLFIYTHEWEYGLRVLNAGYKIKYFEKCKVLHRTSALNRTPKRLKIFSVRNELVIVYKYFSTETRNKYLTRIMLNNVKGVYKYGLHTIPWFYEAYSEFKKMKGQIVHTPVSKEIEDFSGKNIGSTKPFLNIY
ncbi:glycosyltransferase family 2 protein [Mucilaginibacter lacusdianchii]|uniref:glycosyltransferase family 2 protein n=1 Tax=Mucilaginibacter lacusdianchii TaxID=2684211 RepID=UPI00131E1E60|nr:glycosyltransferase [Mucilaginibacter sp. JXJ CY 39]